MNQFPRNYHILMNAGTNSPHEADISDLVWDVESIRDDVLQSFPLVIKRRPVSGTFKDLLELTADIGYLNAEPKRIKFIVRYLEHVSGTKREFNTVSSEYFDELGNALVCFSWRNIQGNEMLNSPVRDY